MATLGAVAAGMKVTTGSWAKGLEWDSEFWRMPVGSAASSHAISEWANEHAEGCLFLLIPAKDQADIHRSEQHGARVMDVRVELTRPATTDKNHDPRALHDIGEIKSGEVGAMVTLARTAFRGLTRFYADPNFPNEKVDNLYESWFRQMLDRDHILVVRLHHDPFGFVTVTRDDRGAHIGLIAVVEWMRGRGWGRLLTDAARHYAAEVGEQRISVVTQGCNVAAQRAFQDCGFRTCDVSVWLHKHFRAKPDAPPDNPSNKSC